MEWCVELLAFSEHTLSDREFKNDLFYIYYVIHFCILVLG